MTVSSPERQGVEIGAGRLPRVLVVHNRYQQPGGEDSVCEAEVALLRRFGHDVEVYERHNDELRGYPAWRAARDTFWSPRTVSDLRALATRFKPDIVHVHNSFPLISPSVYWAAAQAGGAVVQTLHNFRLLCPQGIFLRHGDSCEDCLGTIPWRGVTRACYRDSRPQSALLAAMLVSHRALGTYRHRVARYIALTEFAREKFISGGLPADRIAVKPNFVEESGASNEHARSGGLFVGRLSEQKGIPLLIQALKQMERPTRVRLIGGGDLEELVRATFGADWLGPLPHAGVMQAMASAQFLVLPSFGYEGFPRTLVEAYSRGLPVLASRAGALADIVVERETGLLFKPGDAVDLARAMQWLLDHPGELQRMGERARREYELRYTPEQNYRCLAAIYQDALRQQHRVSTSCAASAA